MRAGAAALGAALVLAVPHTAMAAAGPPAATLATTGFTTLVVRVDGTVWGWGANSYGELGRGAAVPAVAYAGEPAPALVANAKSVAIGDIHTLVADQAGTVWSFGHNDHGQLGDGTTSDRAIPAAVGGLSGVDAVAAGTGYSLAVRNDGTVWAWGDNRFGQLGDGTTVERHVPVQVTGLTGVVAVTASNYQSGSWSMALKSDGTVWAWGNNDLGQLGIGSSVSQATPVQVTALSDVTAIGAGWVHSMAVKDDGTVWTWGYNFGGQLGDGTTTTRRSPVQAAGVSGAVAVAGAWYHSIALRSDGSVWGWGLNGSGQLGDGTRLDRPFAVPSQMTGAVAVAAGGFGSRAIGVGGTVFEWGDITNQPYESTTPLPKPGVVGAATPS